MFPFLVPVFSLPDVSSLARCLFPLGPSGFRASFCFRIFRWALLWLSCLSSRLVCFAVGLFHFLFVPGSSFLLFSFSFNLLLLVPSFPPLARWFSFCCLASARLVRFLWVVFLILFFCGAVLSLPYIRGCSCDACVFLPSASSFYEYAPWRPCRHSSGGFSLCPIRSWHISLARPADFSPGPRSLRFSSFSFSGIFLRRLLVSLRSLSPASSSSSAGSSSSSSAPASSVFHVLACGISRFVGFWRASFLFSFITAASSSSSSSSVFPSFSPKLFRSSSSSVFVSGLLCLLAPWFPMFFTVFSFSGVSSFSSLRPSSLFFLCFRFPTFSAGSESLCRGCFSLFVASPLRQ